MKPLAVGSLSVATMDDQKDPGQGDLKTGQLWSWLPEGLELLNA